MKHKFKSTYNSLLEEMVYNIQSSLTESVYVSEMGILKLYHEGAWQYLVDISPQQWCVWPSIGIRSLYGWRSTNFVESENSMVLPAQFLPPLQFFMEYVDKLIVSFYDRKSRCKKWHEQGLLLIPYAQVCHEVEREAMTFYSVQPASSYEAYTWHCQRIPFKHRVNLSDKTCTCMDTDQFRMPCRHTMAVLSQFNRLDEVFDFYDGCYKTSCYAEMYNERQPIRHPIDQELNCTNVCAPARALALGRRNMNRIASRGEGSTASRKATCVICKWHGYNKRSCPHLKY